jgi:hypothetical protein
MTYVVDAGRGTITYRTRSENYYTAIRVDRMIERMMKRKMPVPSVARDERLGGCVGEVSSATSSHRWAFTVRWLRIHLEQ